MLWGHYGGEGKSLWQETVQAIKKCLLPPADVLFSIVPVDY